MLLLQNYNNGITLCWISFECTIYLLSDCQLNALNKKSKLQINQNLGIESSDYNDEDDNHRRTRTYYRK